MTAKLFPTHFRLILDEVERLHMDHLYNLDPHLVDELELLHKVIDKGIAVMKQEAEENRDPHNMTRTQLSASKSAAVGQLAFKAAPIKPARANEAWPPKTETQRLKEHILMLRVLLERMP